MKTWTVALGGVVALLGIAVGAAGALGGLSVVRTVGISMEPGFRAGDLAVLHRSADYGVGEVVAYHSRDLDTVVLHRIISIDGDRYTFRGDNNGWDDPERPTRDALLGTLALRVPGGGTWLSRLTSPAAIAALGFLVVISGGTGLAVRRRGKRDRRTSGAAPLPTVPPLMMSASGVVVAVALGASVLGAMAWRTPMDAAAAQAASPATLTYSYEATVRPSAAYDGTTVNQPDPVFRNVSERVEVHYAYVAEAPVTDATIAIDAELSTANGWRATVPLAEPVDFSGSRHAGAVELDLLAVQARADAAAAAIGVPPGGEVAVIVIAEVATGEDAVFRPELPLVLEPLALRLADGAGTPLTVADPAAAPTSAGRLPFSVLGYSPPLLQARRASVVALAVALLAAVALLILARRTLAAPEDVGIRRRYAPLLLDVEPVALPAGRPVIEVPVIRGLVRLAERYGLMVMHWQRGGVHTYVVFEEHTTYRFRTGATLPDPDQHRAQPAADERTAQLEPPPRPGTTLQDEEDGSVAACVRSRGAGFRRGLRGR